jgi:hypothetical protein
MSAITDLMESRQRAIAQITEVVVVHDLSGRGDTIAGWAKRDAWLPTKSLPFVVAQSVRLYDAEMLADWKRMYLPETWKPAPPPVWRSVLKGALETVWQGFAYIGLAFIADAIFKLAGWS